MTISIDEPQNAEPMLTAEAGRAGLPIHRLIEQIIAERFAARVEPYRESIQEFSDRIARPGPVIDASRENIYADF